MAGFYPYNMIKVLDWCGDISLFHHANVLFVFSKTLSRFPFAGYDDYLDEDDLDLIEENLGVKVKRRVRIHIKDCSLCRIGEHLQSFRV